VLVVYLYTLNIKRALKGVFVRFRGIGRQNKQAHYKTLKTGFKGAFLGYGFIRARPVDGLIFDYFARCGV